MKSYQIKQKKYKWIIAIILGILIIGGPNIVNMFSKITIVVPLMPPNFNESNLLDYYGVILSGIITLIVLVITIIIGNKNQKEQFEFQMKERQREFEFQMKERQREFEFQIRQRHIEKFEEEIRKIIWNLKFEHAFIKDVENFSNVLVDVDVVHLSTLIDRMKVYLSQKINFVENSKFNIQINGFEKSKEKLNELNKILDNFLQELHSIYKNIILLNEFIIYVINNQNNTQIINNEKIKADYSSKVAELGNQIDRYNMKNNLENNKFLNKSNKILKLLNEESIKLKNNEKDN